MQEKDSNLSIMSLSCFRAHSLSVSIILINCDVMSDSTILSRVERMFWLTVFFEVTDLTGTCFLLLLLVEEASSPILESTESGVSDVETSSPLYAAEGSTIRSGFADAVLATNLYKPCHPFYSLPFYSTFSFFHEGNRLTFRLDVLDFVPTLVGIRKNCMVFAI